MTIGSKQFNFCQNDSFDITTKTNNVKTIHHFTPQKLDYDVSIYDQNGNIRTVFSNDGIYLSSIVGINNKLNKDKFTETSSSYYFANLENMESYKSKSKMKSLESYAFLNCKNIRLNNGMFSELSVLNSQCLKNACKYSDHYPPALFFPNVLSVGDKVFESFGYVGTKVCIDLPNATDFGTGVFSTTFAISAINAPNVTNVHASFMNCQYMTYCNVSSTIEIGEYCFYPCKALTNLNVPYAKKIGKMAFSGCISLQSINIQSATNIGNGTFTNCSSLKEIHFENRPEELTAVPSIGTNVFSGCNQSTLSIFVPLSMEERWKGAAGWSQVEASCIYGL